MTVTTTAEFDAALLNAKGGDTIQLAAGDYTLNILQRAFSPPLTITSADPTKPANVTRLNAINTNGLNLSRLKLTVLDDSTYNPFTVNYCDGVSVTDCTLTGPGLAIKVEASNLFFRNSKDVSALRCDFSGAVFGLQVLENDGLTVTDCHFHDLRSDGIRGGGNSNVTYERNLFHDFYPITEDHPDAMQFWTQAVTHASSNIVVRDNVMVRGKGMPFQGVFIRDEDLKYPYSNVTVTGNILLGGHYNGISLDGVDSATVTGNTVIGFPGQESWVMSRNCGAGLSIAGNTATGYVTQVDEAGDNTKVEYATDGGKAALFEYAAFSPAPGNMGSWDKVMTMVYGTTPVPTPTPVPAPQAKTDLLARLAKARLEANGLVNDAKRALYAIDRAIENANAL